LIVLNRGLYNKVLGNDSDDSGVLRGAVSAEGSDWQRGERKRGKR
jgi:hypothetical protein